MINKQLYQQISQLNIAQISQLSTAQTSQSVRQLYVKNK
jgi:hypothetical protein